MQKIKIFFSVMLIFILAFFLSFFALQFAKQKGREDLFRFANPYDLVIKNARIIDGTGGEIFDANIGISKGKIKKISQELVRGNADVFDATGYTLIPEMVDIPEETDWVTRDLPGAMSRFPYYRIFFRSSEDSNLAGRSLEAVLREGLYNEEFLRSEFNWRVLIAPEGEDIDSDSIISAIYKLTGWRSESLNLAKGKITEGFEMEALLYRTKDIDEKAFLNSLNNEIMPKADFSISGNEVTNEKTGLVGSYNNTEDASKETDPEADTGTK